MKKFRDEKGRECIGIDGIACKYKLWEEFNKDKHNRQGYQPRCKACTKVYRQRPEYKKRNASRYRRNVQDSFEYL